MKRKAFTLIEVMVVLSILAIIAILAYNFFGSTMKDAKLSQGVTKMYNDLRILSEGADKFYMDNNTYTGISQGGGIAKFGGLVDAGIIKAVPVPDQDFVVDASTRYYDFTNGYMDFGGATTAQDMVIYSPDGYISDELCKAFNDKYTNYGPNIWDCQANAWEMAKSGVDFIGPALCMNFMGTGAVDENTVYYLHELY